MTSLAERSPRSGGALPSAPATPAAFETRPIGDNLSRVFVDCLAACGIRHAFGVSGGAIAQLYDALEGSSIDLVHFRHESGAAFAATEASLATGRPVLVFATAGPGSLNSLTGMTAARWEGAKVLLVSGATNSADRGRWATQETSSYTMPQDGLCSKGPIFDFGVCMESGAELPEVMRRLAQGFERPGGFVAHVSLPMAVLSSWVLNPGLPTANPAYEASVKEAHVASIAHRLLDGTFTIWVGFGARRAADKVHRLMEHSGAMVCCSPRAKGIVSERHPQFLGVTGLGGHESVVSYMHERKPDRTLVLGTRLSEATSFWNRDLMPRVELIHVDIDSEVPGTAFPDVPTVGVQAEIGAFLDSLLRHFPSRTVAHMPARAALPGYLSLAPRTPVRPQVLMDVLQRRVVDGSSALVLAECGNSFAWCNHYLRFPDTGRYRASTLFGSMGHAATGVVGASLAARRKAVAVVGDGSMMMLSEISTAVQHCVQAIWVVLNDSGYGMCRDGHEALGLAGESLDVPPVDFVALAQSFGAHGLRVESEDRVELAVEEAMVWDGPVVIDLIVDRHERSPLRERFESLLAKRQSSNDETISGWRR